MRIDRKAATLGTNLGSAVATTGLLLLLTACGGGGGGGRPPPMEPPPPAVQEPIPPPLDPTGQALGDFYAVTNRNRFVTLTPGLTALSTNLAITGIVGGEQIVALDVRTVDGTVYAFSNLGVLYTLNPRSGAAQRVAQRSSAPPGSNFGMEFIAAPEELRIVADNGSAFTVGGFNVLNAGMQDPLSIGMRPASLPSGITEIAGTQNAMRCGRTSLLYYLDTARDLLLVEDPQGEDLSPRSVGSLGVDADASSGFEIFQPENDSDVAVAALRVGGVLSLYDIDLSSGRASARTSIPGLRSNETLVGLARPAPPQPRARVGSTVALTASGKLISFDELAPLALCGPPVAITGLQERESLIDIDMRPGDGLVYGVSNAARVYTISTELQSLGVAALKATLQADPLDTVNPFDGTIDPATTIEFNARDDLLIAIDAANRLNSIDVDSGLVNTDDFSFLPNDQRFLPAGFGSFAPSPNLGLQFGLGLFSSGPLPAPGTVVSPRPLDVRGSDGLALQTTQFPGLPNSALVIGEVFGAGPPRGIGGSERVIGLTYVPRPRATVFALTINNRLLQLNPSAPETPQAVVQISGIQAGDTLLAIDFRPIDGALYGLTDRGRIYVIDPASGAATLRSVLTPASNDTTFETFVNLEADISFSPISGQLRVSVSGGRNLRVDVDTGRVITDSRLSRASSLPKPPAFAGIAFLPPLDGETFGKLILLDSANQRLAGLIGPGVTVPRTIREISRLDSAITEMHGFDSAGFATALFLADTATERHVLYEVDFSFSSRRVNRRGVLPLPSDARVTSFAATPVGQQNALFVVLNGQRLITLSTDPQQPPSSPIPLTGLAPDEVLLSLDIDNNANLVGLGSSGRLYFINQITGAASPGFALTGDALEGTRFDMDFDRFGTTLAIASDTGQLLSVDGGGRAIAQKLEYARVAATPIAHTNSFPGPPKATLSRLAGTPVTTRFFIDTVSAALLAPREPALVFVPGETQETSEGELVNIGPILPPLDFRSFSPLAAFDVIGGHDVLALAALQTDLLERSMLYRIQVGTFVGFSNAGQPIGPIGPPGTGPIRGLAIRLQ